MNHALLFLKENDVVKKAMSIIDKTKAKLALVLDKKDSLIGTVTDGDIRRAILRGEALQSPVKNIMNKKFKYLEESISINNLIKCLRGIFADFGYETEEPIYSSPREGDILHSVADMATNAPFYYQTEKTEISEGLRDLIKRTLSDKQGR